MADELNTEHLQWLRAAGSDSVLKQSIPERVAENLRAMGLIEMTLAGVWSLTDKGRRTIRHRRSE